jgi:hypothetical protein
MIFYFAIVGCIAALSLSWAVFTTDKVERTLAIYTCVVASGLFIYLIMKG